MASILRSLRILKRISDACCHHTILSKSFPEQNELFSLYYTIYIFDMYMIEMEGCFCKVTHLRAILSQLFCFWFENKTKRNTYISKSFSKCLFFLKSDTQITYVKQLQKGELGVLLPVFYETMILNKI